MSKIFPSPKGAAGNLPQAYNQTNSVGPSGLGIPSTRLSMGYATLHPWLTSAASSRLLKHQNLQSACLLLKLSSASCIFDHRQSGCYNCYQSTTSFFMGRKLDLLEIFRTRKQMPGNLIVLSGPSGVGKDTVLRALKGACPGLDQCVTFTTRQPRPGEVPGKDYNFVSAEEFQRMIDDGEFLEYARVHLDSYGTPLASVTKIRETGRDAVLKIDVQGGCTVKEKVADAVLIFVAPPSMEELERRLRSRYTDSEEAITKRLNDARNEIAQIQAYDFLVVNHDVETTVEELRCIVMAERARVLG